MRGQRLRPRAGQLGLPHLHDRRTQSLRGPFNVNDLFNEGGKEFTSDPRCWFDPTDHTWFATILFLNDAFTAGRMDIAVNTDQRPDRAVEGVPDRHDATTGRRPNPAAPASATSRGLASTRTTSTSSTDEFSILGPQFNGGQIYAIAKHDLVVGRSSAHFVHFANLTIGGALPSPPSPR